MNTTVKRGLLVTIFTVMAMFLWMNFSTPLEAFANPDGSNPNDVDVKLTAGADGKMGFQVTGGGFTSGGSASAWEDFIGKYRNFITGIAGIGAVTMVVLFIIQFIKLGASAGNPQARSQALVGVLWTGIAAAGLGAVTIIVGFFYNAVG